MNALKIQPLKALVKRDYLEQKNALFWTAIALGAINLGVLLLAALQIGHFSFYGPVHVADIADSLNRLSENPATAAKLPIMISFLYAGFALSILIALPFTIFFSLLGAFYEDRRDKSVLFWKSMPVADWQEVLVKFVTYSFGALIIYAGFVLVFELAAAFILSLISFLKGGPVLVFWPLQTMLLLWATGLALAILCLLWLSPFLAWLLLISSYATRMVFFTALLPFGVVITLEGVLFSSHEFANWLGYHLVGWINFDRFDFDLTAMSENLSGYSYEMVLSPMMKDSFGNVEFWLGLFLAGALLFLTVKLRQKAI